MPKRAPIIIIVASNAHSATVRTCGMLNLNFYDQSHLIETQLYDLIGFNQNCDREQMNSNIARMPVVCFANIIDVLFCVSRFCICWDSARFGECIIS